MQQGKLSSKALTQFYLDRIEAIDRNDPILNSIIEINPHAMKIASAFEQAANVRKLPLAVGKK